MFPQENLLAVMAILVIFKQVLHFLTLILSALPNVMHF